MMHYGFTLNWHSDIIKVMVVGLVPRFKVPLRNTSQAIQVCNLKTRPMVKSSKRYVNINLVPPKEAETIGKNNFETIIQPVQHIEYNTDSALTHRCTSWLWDKPDSSTRPLVICPQSQWSSWRHCPSAQNLKTRREGIDYSSDIHNHMSQVHKTSSASKIWCDVFQPGVVV